MKTMTYSGTSKSRNRNTRTQNKNRNMNRYDEDDDEDVVRLSNNRQQSNKKRVDNNKFEVVGEVVKIKTTRKEIYHDGEGNRTYGSWK